MLSRSAKFYGTLKRVFSFAASGLRFAAQLVEALVDFKLDRLLDPNWSVLELDEVDVAHTWRGVPVEGLAPAKHEHDYVGRDQTVEVAHALRKDGKDYKPSELAPARHTHTEYVKKDELVAHARRLGGVLAEDFALARHEHEEYVKKTDVVDAAFEIAGYTAADFAPFFHDHGDRYYRRDETVDDAWELVGDKAYTPYDFAPANHTHAEYLTREEAERIFLKRDEPPAAAEAIEATVLTVEPTTKVESVGSTNFALLQMPHAIDSAKSEVTVATRLASQRQTTVQAYATECFTCPGRWFEAKVPSGRIVAAILTVEGEKPKQLTHFIAWKNDKFRVYQYDYPGAVSTKVRLLFFVEPKP